MLNASFEPLCVVSVRRAVVLVLKEKAVIVSRDDGRAPFRADALPGADRHPADPLRAGPVPVRVPLSRRAVFARDGHRCQYCGRPAENIDHVVPRSRGGEHAWENVVAALPAVQRRKENRMLAETDLRLHRRPVAPHATLWVIATAGSIDPAWEPYLPALESVPA